MEFAYMSWEAAATFATGVLAVGAALLVGLRQVSIQERQACIQGELRKLEALKVKVELFDRRMEVYLSVDNWLTEMCFRGSVKEETEAAFYRGKDNATFLFRDEVNNALLEWWGAAQVLRNAGDNIPAEKVEAARGHLRAAFAGRRALFAPELEMPSLD